MLVCTLGLTFTTQLTFAQQSAAQNITVKGKVVDDRDGQGIPGITIVDNNRKVVGVTNENGDFSVNVPKGISLSFSMIGYTAVTRTFSEAQSSVVIRIKESSSQLSEVVVTALGIKREEKSLGYATTKLDSTSFTDAVSSNWTDALSGKVAGLNLVRNGGPAGSNKIILRGENNLTGDNEALIVIDGVVASSSARRTGGTGGGVYGTSGDIMPADFGSALNDLNPDDIESVNVLKGPGASALYGQRGANGAIIITTKGANKNRKKLGVTFTSNTAWEEVNRKPDIQQEYGQGQFGVSYFSYGASDDGASTNATSASWGAPFANGGNFFQYDPATKTRGLVRTPW
ncbi:MAG: SusC/RagA family TonB-linked outer membrane protein, partial [Flavobacterium sp.]